MGQNSSAHKQNILKKEELDDLVNQTHYDRKEIQQLYQQFREEVPSGFIPKKDFGQLTELLGIKDAFISDLVFNAFDKNSDGNIEFKEFITTMSIITRGDKEEKLKFAFKLYDLNNDGYISRQEMIQVISCLYCMLGDLVSLQGEEFDTPMKLVERIFAEMDTNRDGLISFEEYRTGSLKDQAIINGLGLF